MLLGTSAQRMSQRALVLICDDFTTCHFPFLDSTSLDTIRRVHKGESLFTGRGVWVCPGRNILAGSSFARVEPLKSEAGMRG